MGFAFGHCSRCREWGALWKVERKARKYWLFGPLVTVYIYRCDECESKP